MPIRSITELVASDACRTWLESAASPSDPRTAENDSSTGTPAATNAPKASSRTRNVTGRVRVSAREKSWPVVSSSSCSALASPNSVTVKPGACRRSAATRASTGFTREPAVSGEPRMSNWTIAAWRSAEIWSGWPLSGPLTPLACGSARTARSTRWSSLRKAGSPAACAALRTSTASLACRWKPASVSARSARAGSPLEFSTSVSLAVPASWPRITAAATKASQPKVAVFQCPALQRAARSAMFGRIQGLLSGRISSAKEASIRGARRQRGGPASCPWG